MEHDEITAQIEAELARLKVADVLLHTVTTVAALAYRRLSDDDRDLEQVQLAIASLQAIVPVLATTVAPDVQRDFRQVIANLQLAYADAVSA
jgi:hypothetical protein